MMIKKIGVIGAGTMGHGIALVCAKAGFDVAIQDVKDEYVKKGLAAVEKFLSKSVEKGKMAAEEKHTILGHIKGTTKLEDLADVDVVVEAIFEDVKTKKEVFAKLDQLCKKETIFASNTSTIPITDLASSKGPMG